MNGVAHANTAWKTTAIASTNIAVAGHGRFSQSTTAAPRLATREPGDSTARQRLVHPAIALPSLDRERRLGAEQRLARRPELGEPARVDDGRRVRIDQEPLDLDRVHRDALLGPLSRERLGRASQLRPMRHQLRRRGREQSRERVLQLDEASARRRDDRIYPHAAETLLERRRNRS